MLAAPRAVASCVSCASFSLSIFAARCKTRNRAEKSEKSKNQPWVEFSLSDGKILCIRMVADQRAQAMPVQIILVFVRGEQLARKVGCMLPDRHQHQSQHVALAESTLRKKSATQSLR